MWMMCCNLRASGGKPRGLENKRLLESLRSRALCSCPAGGPPGGPHQELRRGALLTGLTTQPEKVHTHVSIITTGKSAETSVFQQGHRRDLCCLGPGDFTQPWGGINQLLLISAIKVPTPGRGAETRLPLQNSGRPVRKH